MRPATRLITPWCFSSTPRTRSAGELRATVRKRFQIALGADHVDEPGLVLEVEEHRALRGRRLLAVRHHSGDLDDAAVGELAQIGRGDHALAGQLVAHELGGVLADARCPSPTGRRRPSPSRSCPAARGASAPVTTPGSVSTTAPSRRTLGPRGAERARGPQRRAARLAEAVLERARGRERLDLVDGRAGTPHEVLEVGERPHRRARRRCGRAARRAGRAPTAARAAPRGATARRGSRAPAGRRHRRRRCAARASRRGATR